MLIHPPSSRVARINGERGLKAAVLPLGLAYLASVLRDRGYEVKILDCIIEGYDNEEIEVEPEIFRYGLTDEQIAGSIQDFKPDVVCISCLHAIRQPEADTVARISKIAAPTALVVMGGASPTALKERIFDEPAVDYLLRGEGELRLPIFLEALAVGGRNLEKVDGLIYRDGGRIVSNPLKMEPMQIDTIPFPAYDLLPMEKYFNVRRNPSVHSSKGRTSIMISSRGCGMTCYYCPVHNIFGPTGPDYRMRSVDNVLAEIEHLVTHYGIEEIQFEDANFNASPKRTIALSRAIGERFPGLRWCTPHGNQLSTLTDEVLTAMREGGCYSLHLAIESGNQGFLDARKGWVRLDRLTHILETATRLGFKKNAFLMIGYPEETREDIQRTVDYAMVLDLDDVHFFIATPFPGTEMYDICKRSGWLDLSLSLRHFRYSCGVIKTENFDPAYLQKVRREGWLCVRKKIEKKHEAIKLTEMEEEVYG